MKSARQFMLDFSVLLNLAFQDGLLCYSVSIGSDSASPAMRSALAALTASWHFWIAQC